MSTAHLLLGTNIGERERHLDRALSLLSGECLLEELFSPSFGRVEIQAVSHVYETAAWGKLEQDDYLNQVVRISTTLSPHHLLKLISAIETRMGRVRRKVWEPRIIDLDILFYGSEIIREEKLVVPHPHLQDRRFALTPLAEIAPDMIHPVLRKSVQELLRICSDPLSVREYVTES